MEQEAIDKLIRMSAYAGERFDLVQAGGGNTSVKYGETMLIKASGYLLSELQEGRGYTGVKTAAVLNVLNHPSVKNTEDKRDKDKRAGELLAKSIVLGQDRPSIETYLHALLYRYTCHVHSIAVNVLTSSKNWEEATSQLYPRSLLIPYETPGIELALLLRDQLEEYVLQYGILPKVIFLQNHGLIISSDKFDEVKELMEEVVLSAENISGLDLARYRRVSEISSIYEEAFNHRLSVYHSEDATIIELLKNRPELAEEPPFSPDGYVFCGYKILVSEHLDANALIIFAEKYHEPPKLILIKDQLYILAADLKKAKMIEDVLKNNMIIADYLKDNLVHLSHEEIKYLGNWEAEKYRQQR
ncbi:class II aldolase/adducin family protein [Zeaxanthinibacter sp. PT1]|uniref:class II aldolase/adducin family protein n=1 Tax=Zeaxanthinibacter TaxID=561554 RepID=UPI00234A2F56|nr:class II aldolase/adducin family protein [Zeaxanthinibacter sp. PT1]MDC6350607.1 class II aldolase/adducin family protein [Zeaxanthinibacter sp. PT1]